MYFLFWKNKNPLQTYFTEFFFNVFIYISSIKYIFISIIYVFFILETVDH
jgi:hypothetical protein